MKKNNLWILVFLTSLMGCYQGEQADLIIHNAKIYSCDEAFNVYEAMAIRDGKIIQLGPEREILNGYVCDEIIDAQLRPIYPGFYDGHCHFMGFAQTLGEANLKGAQSFNEIVSRMEEFAIHSTSEWLLGRGWDQTLWQDKKMPTNEKLNELFPNRPVLIRRVDGHAAIANAKALEIANINNNSFIEGGIIGLENGKLTGLLLDNAYDSVAKCIPELMAEQKLELLKKAEQKLFEVGLTSINDAGINAIDRALYEEWYSNHQLKIKSYAMLFPDSENMGFATKNGPYKKGNLHIRSFKIIADGALGSRGACLIEPYHDDKGNYGIMLSDTSNLKDIAYLAKEIGYQMNTHCIGDSANKVMLNIYADVIQDQPDHRWKIEHAQVIQDQDFSLFTALKVIPSVQPTHCTSDMRWAQERLGSERLKHAYAYKRLLQEAGTIVLGTDFPVEAIYPLETFYAAITRQSKDGQPIGGFYPDQTLSRADALRGMTIWAAESNFEEDSRGSLEPGKAADFVILTKDIMKVDAKEILTTYVAKTFLDGVMVFDGE
ncbi:amidohydrolase [Crocinitomix algicola]|uniref:amidohydrolase n=1 Tax=Crocinitomix algicola TaxID=1740263 RepID=UPI00082A1A31|nr:amidohydrolase [Crocinitomix algicola]